MNLERMTEQQAYLYIGAFLATATLFFAFALMPLLAWTLPLILAVFYVLLIFQSNKINRITHQHNTLEYLVANHDRIKKIVKRV